MEPGYRDLFLFRVDKAWLTVGIPVHPKGICLTGHFNILLA